MTLAIYSTESSSADSIIDDARSHRGGRCGGEPLCADEDIPRLDAHRKELFCTRPGVVGEAALDLSFAGCIYDQQHPEASVLASGERPAEEDEPLVCEQVHERRVVAHCRLIADPLPVCPGGSRFADDGEVAHLSLPSGSGDQIVELVVEPVAPFGSAVRRQS